VKTPLQTFQYREIPRSAITNAPYNPRTITPVARAKLQGLLERHGLVETLVWNGRTGHLVGGHQRLSIIDDLEGGAAYSLGVAAIDVDERREVELNVALNNEHLRGEFDPDRFFALLRSEPAPTLDGMGYTKADLEMEFGAGPDLDAVLGAPPAAAEPPVVVEDDEDAAAIAEAAGASPGDGPAPTAEAYLLIAFPTWTVKERFLMALERPGDLRLMAGDELQTYVRGGDDGADQSSGV
jgi:hypothetical protein